MCCSYRIDLLINIYHIIYSFIAVGYAAGIIAVVFISILCMWCQFLLVSLLAEYEHIIATNPNHPRHGDKNFTASYHDVSEYPISMFVM